MIVQVELECGRILYAQKNDADKHAMQFHRHGRVSALRRLKSSGRALRSVERS